MVIMKQRLTRFEAAVSPFFLFGLLS